MGDVCLSPHPGKRDFNGTSWRPQRVSSANDGHADWFLTHVPGTQMPSDWLVSLMVERRGDCWVGNRLVPRVRRASPVSVFSGPDMSVL